MIPTKHEQVEVLNNIDADATGQFTVDENSLAKIMSVLTNLYSDPEGAVVREYLTNALDAQIEAQESDPNYVWRPIEVTTPSHFSKEYKVRDFGTGMTVDDIKDIYSKYGKSTKEHSNAVTGMLGLGSKCALTYTGQFTITGYKNGVRTRAVVSKDDNDIPIFMIVDTRATDEPNGVEISVPVRDRNSFAQKTREFLRWWKDGQVLVDGAEPPKHGLTLVDNSPRTFTINGEQVTAPVEIYIRERVQNNYRWETPQSVIVQGNVPYAVDDEYVAPALRNTNLGFVAYVPMGAVDFPPDREKLFYNLRTKKVVGSLSEGLFEKILKEKLDEITNAPDHKTAYQKYQTLEYHFSSTSQAKQLKYKGLDFQSRIQHAHRVLDWDWQGHGQISDRQWIDLSGAMAGALVVTGCDPNKKPTSYFKKKVKYWMETNNHTHPTALLVDDDIDNAWLAWLPRIDADTIKAIKLPKDAPSGAPRAEATYEYWTIDSAGNPTRADDTTITVPKGKTLTYCSPQDLRETYRKQGTTAQNVIKRIGSDYILVVLGKNRHEKFLRTYPSAVRLKTVFQNLIDGYVAKATDAEYVIGRLSYAQEQFLSKVKVSEINDPDLVDLANMVQGGKATMNYKKAEELHAYSRRCDVVCNLPERKDIKNGAIDRYPLIESVGSRQMKHLLIYINAVWEQTKK